MISQWKKALVAIAFAALAPLTIAQVISVPGGNGAIVPGGSTISVGFSDPTKAGQTIRLTVSNNEEDPDYEETILEITLDSLGKGSTNWVVEEAWEQAAFFGEGAVEVLVDVT